ncbi:MAG: hypothetical protein QXY40_02775 [Candidatus Methanomethylicia archaeon]
MNRKIIEEAIKHLEKLYSRKSKSFFMRCKARLRDVRKSSKNMNTWLIRGRPGMGDYDQIYIVKYDEENRRYECSCYNPLKQWSNRRRREVCTHVGAVILLRLLELHKQRRFEDD